MKKMIRKSGFTLIEMLVVIAIISVLVSMVVPAVSGNILKAEAAADAANLRSVLGQVNSILVSNDKLTSITAAELKTTDSVSFPGAKTYILYCDTHFVETYYVLGDAYYSVDYFAEIADSGESDESTVKPTPPAGSGMVYEWFEAGKGAVTED